MSALSQEKAINAFKKLGAWLRDPTDILQNATIAAKNQNSWFSEHNILKAISSLGHMLNDDDIEKWNADIQFANQPKKIGLVLAGNIPMVGFHDILCVLATGNIALVKLSSNDKILIQIAISQLIYFEPAFADRVEYVERLVNFNAVIATGSNNSSRYFDFYFGKAPNIIRKNRNSVAVLTGNENDQMFNNLGSDIFDYFGLGCRNVSKLFVPQNYNFDAFFKGIQQFEEIKNHFKYNNNYDYNKSIYLVNLVPHLDNGFLLLKEDSSTSSPLAVLYYEQYKNATDLDQKLQKDKDLFQCVVSDKPLAITTFKFGQSQQPKLWDYADNINTIDFLNGLN